MGELLIYSHKEFSHRICTRRECRLSPTPAKCIQHRSVCKKRCTPGCARRQ